MIYYRILPTFIYIAKQISNNDVRNKRNFRETTIKENMRIRKNFFDQKMRWKILCIKTYTATTIFVYGKNDLFFVFEIPPYSVSFNIRITISV